MQKWKEMMRKNGLKNGERKTERKIEREKWREKNREWIGKVLGGGSEEKWVK